LRAELKKSGQVECSLRAELKKSGQVECSLRAELKKRSEAESLLKAEIEKIAARANRTEKGLQIEIERTRMEKAAVERKLDNAIDAAVTEAKTKVPVQARSSGRSEP
jgi:hypothetical protein